ncbi:Fic family protein [Chitinophaga caseinilytica]|uniref:Fic family protein n=1 Tax=Chitinophaga caseinilytica TaxID=2267521 RepID=A0ABZ2Z7Q5_9BACT
MHGIEKKKKKELTPVELAALLHYRFVRIHPFDDGNGRMARLLMNFVLLKNQLAPIIIKSTDKKNYLFALNQADAGEIGAFVDYIVQQLCWSLNLYIRAANGEEIDENDDLQKEISVWKKGLKGDEKESSHRTTELVLELFLKGGLLDLFKEFESQIGQFRDLFYDSSLEYMLNGGHTQSNFHNFKEMVVSFPGRDSIFNLSARAVLRDFKPLPNPSIAFFPHVAINFEFNRYNVRSENGILMIKPYTVNLSSKDRSDILDPIIRQLFTDVKTAARIKG